MPPQGPQRSPNGGHTPPVRAAQITAPAAPVNTRCPFIPEFPRVFGVNLQRPILSVHEIRAVEAWAVSSGDVSEEVLMDRAGTRVAAELLSRHHYPAGSAVVLAGPGNNGGDGYVAGLRLREAGWHVRVVPVIASPTLDKTTPCSAAARAWTDAAGPLMVPAEPDDASTLADGCDWIIDAVFGIGLVRPVEDPLATLFASVEAAGVPVVAVDVPSGLDADHGVPLGRCLRADLTVTFIAAKRGFQGASLWTGPVVVDDLGINGRGFSAALGHGGHPPT